MLQTRIIKRIKTSSGVLLYIMKAIKDDRSPNLYTYYIVRHCNEGLKVLDKTHSRNRALQATRVIEERLNKSKFNVFKKLPIGKINTLY